MQAHNDEDPSQAKDQQPAPGADEPELAESIGHRARMRALRIGAAATLVAAVVAVITTSDGGSSASPASAHGTAPKEINALLAGIPESGNTLGSPSAPVTLQYFGDLECSTARAFTLEDLPSIIRDWVRPGKMRIEYRSLRTVSEPNTFGTQQIAALAAGRQNKLWYYIENFYHKQGHEHTGYVTENYLTSLARQVPGLNLKQWRQNRHEPELADQVVKDEQAASAAYLHSTPSLLIGRTGSTRFRPTARFSIRNPTPFNESAQQIYGRSVQGVRTATPRTLRGVAGSEPAPRT